MLYLIIIRIRLKLYAIRKNNNFNKLLLENKFNRTAYSSNKISKKNIFTNIMLICSNQIMLFNLPKINTKN